MNEIFQIEPLLKVAEVASVLNVSPSCIRELARKGVIKGIKFTSDWRFKKSAVNEFISKHEYHGYQTHKTRLAG